MNIPTPPILCTSKTKKKYTKITAATRLAFIKRVKSKEVTIKEVIYLKKNNKFIKAANEFGLKLSTSKAILHIFRKEGRIGKKQTRIRKEKKKELKNVTETNMKKDEKTQTVFENNSFGFNTNPNHLNSFFYNSLNLNQNFVMPFLWSDYLKFMTFSSSYFNQNLLNHFFQSSNQQLKFENISNDMKK